ncbi:MAG: hypothetical protein WBW99_11925 [Pseudolabrys sp.]
MRCDSHIPLREKAPLANRFPAIAGLARELNWHIEFVAPLKMINENAELLKTSRVPAMIDHYGFYTGVIPEESEGAALLKLLAMPHMWIKLSAPYLARIRWPPSRIRHGMPLSWQSRRIAAFGAATGHIRRRTKSRWVAPRSRLIVVFATKH